MQDTVDIIKTIQNVYENDPVFSVLKDYERVLDELGLYVYDNWEDGELVEGPIIGRHFVQCSFMYPRDKMPDPMGGKRLLDYDCKVTFKKDHVIEPRKIIISGYDKTQNKSSKNLDAIIKVLGLKDFESRGKASFTLSNLGDSQEIIVLEN